MSDTSVGMSLEEEEPPFDGIMNDATIRAIISDNYKNAKTSETYTSRLNVLQSTCDNKPLFEILKNPESHYETLKAKYTNIITRKNMLTLILALFKYSTRLKNLLTTQYQQWAKYHDYMDRFVEAQYEQQRVPDARQLAKYTPFEDMEAKYLELQKTDPHQTLQSSLHYVFLSIILSTPPKRADYGEMKIYRDKDPKVKDANYVVLHTNSKTPSYFVFRAFKTQEKYIRIDEVIPTKTLKDITTSLRRYPRENLFINRFGNPYSNKLFSKFVIRAFETMFGRATGVTMLRHIYITEKVDMNDAPYERAEIARQMMHTTGLQAKYNWDKKAICENLKRICGDC
jgi:hypothetical protein